MEPGRQMVLIALTPLLLLARSSVLAWPQPSVQAGMAEVSAARFVSWCSAIRLSIEAGISSIYPHCGISRIAWMHPCLRLG